MAEQKTTLGQKLRDFPILQFLMIVGVSLLMLQVLAYIVGLFYAPAGQLKLGWVVLIISATIAVYLSTEIIRTRIIGGASKPFTRGEVFVLILMIGGVVAALIYLPPLVPQVFDQAVIQLQSIVGLP